MTFRELLTKYNLSKVSVALQKKIKQYDILEADIASMKAQHAAETAIRKKKKLEDDIAEAEENLVELNNELCKGIERYNKNKPAYEKAGRLLNGGNTNEPNNDPPANDPPANDPPANDPPANDPPANDPPANDPPANDPPANDPPANDPPANDPPANDPPANDPPANDPPANDPPADEPPVKKKSGWGLVVGALIAVAGIAAGINFLQNRR